MSRLRRLSSLLFASIIALGSLTLSANALATTVRLEIEDWDAFFKARAGQGETTPGLSTGDGGVTVGAIDRNDSFTYNINIPVGGGYIVTMRSARGLTSGEEVRFEVDGAPVTGQITVPPTSGWNAYETQELATLSLTPGAHTLTIVYDGGINTNWFELTLEGATQTGNTPPVLSAMTNQSNTEGESVSLQVSATDADNDTLTYSVTGLPNQLSLDAGIGQITGTVTEAGTYNVTITVDDNNGGSASESFIWTVSTPNSDPTVLFIEAEDYKLGGEGVGYHDTTPERIGGGNNGRTDAVDMQDTTDTSANNLNIGFVALGEWLAYDVTIPVTGSYQLALRTARNLSDNGELHLESNGADVSGLLTVLPTTGWQTYRTTTFTNISLNAGFQTLRLVFDNSSTNINWFRLTLEGATNDVPASSSPPSNTAPTASGASINVNPGQSISSLLTASDADGDNLTYSLVTPPSDGSVVIVGEGNYTYTPFAGRANTNDTFQFKVNDGQVDSNTATVNIAINASPQNAAPTASNKTISLVVNSSYDSTQSGNSKLSATDPENDVLTYQIVGYPAQGIVSLSNSSNSSNGHFLYTNTLSEAGQDSFTYLVTDSASNQSNVATVTVNLSGGATNIISQNPGIRSSTTSLVPANGIPTSGPINIDSFTFVDVGGILTPIPIIITIDGTRIRADFNGDGRTDTLVQATNSSNSTYLFLADSAGNYTNGAISLSSSELGNLSSASITASNVDGDSARELIVTAGDGIATTINVSGNTVTATNKVTFTDLPITTGTTDAQFSVGEDGQASYTIPIFTPPGQGGMQPSLVFNLSTMGGGTFMGLGGGLGGLSAITRCGRTIASDGVAGSVGYNSNDRFCMEGQRLVATSGAYGANGTEYRTELDTFSKVISHGAAGSGPAYFEVSTKSGNKLFYGNTTDSRIEAQGKSSVAVWAVNKIMDAVGNDINVTYTENTATGEYTPKDVTYAPNNKVEFYYDDRVDPFTGYQLGSKVSSTKLLRAVRATHDNNLVREYRLDYNTSPTSVRTRLESVQECTTTQCYRPITLAWEDGSNEVESIANTGWTGQIHDRRYEYVDMNGDGYTDIVEFRRIFEQTLGVRRNVRDGSIYYYLNNKNNGFGNAILVASANRVLLAPDMNGDGKPEVLSEVISGGGCCGSFSRTTIGIQYSTANGYGNLVTLASYSNGNTAVHASLEQTTFGDFNGDGLADLNLATSIRGNNIPASFTYSSSVLLANGYGGFTVTSGWNINYGFNKPSSPIDLNGDGLADLRLSSFGNRINTGSGFVNVGTTYSVPNSSIFQDMNGDGITDVVELTSSATNVRLGTGTGFLGPQNWRNFGSAVANLTFNDVNADGRVDALVLTGGRFRVYLSTGSGFDDTERYWGTGLGSSVSNLSFGDFNADGRTDIFRRSGSTGYIHTTDPAAMTDRLTTLTNGYGSQIKFNYGLTNDPAVHEADNNSTFPRYDINAPMRVIASTDVSDSIGGWHNTRYKYYGAKGDRHGRGFLGFRQIQTYEDIHLDGSESVTTTIYSQSYPHTGSVLSSETRVDNTKVSESTNTYAMHSSNAGIEYPYLQSNTTHTWDIDASNSLVDSKTTTNVYDDYGNPTRIIISTTGDGKTHTVTTDNNYYPANISQWHLDRLQQTTVTSSDASSAIPTVVRVSDFQYNTNGLLSMERIEPNAGNALTLTTDYVYDSFGNITSQTVTGWNGSAPDALESRTTSTTYIDGTFPNTISNAIGQQETRVYDSALGVMLSQIGPNSLPTTWQYDSFGRRILETRPDNTSSHWQYGDCDNTAVQYCASTVTTTTSGAAPSTVYSDNLGRQLQSEGISFDGRKVIQHSVYNRLGQNDKATQPHFAGGTRYYTRFDYDNLGRIVHEIQPGFAGNGELKTQTIYQGRTQRIYTDINARNLKMKKVFDARGNVVEMRDYDGDIGFITQYRYDPIGNLLATVDAEGNTSSIRYDIRDRKVSMNDPDMGVWSYSYNAFGELIGQTDAQNNIVSMRYDKLGRLISRTEPEGSTTWSYDTAPGAGVGKLHSVSRTQDSYRQSFTYDSLGRSSASQTHILNQDYNVSTQYDRFSRIQSRVYPTGFSTRNHYTANGYLERVTEAASNKLYWQALAVDEFGNISQEKFGNGVESTMAYDAKTGYLQAISTGNGGIQNLSYTYDNLSNLMSRNDTLTGTNETFTYDSLNRLTQMNSSEYGVKTYDYTKLGNITQKSDFGADYVYGQNNAGPHAVTQVKRADGSTVARYNYDNNGRMTSGNGRTITWSSFNKPTKITRDTNGVAKEVNFIYGPDRARIAQQGTDSTTIYLQGTGAHFEKETQGSITRQRHFIYGGNGMAAIYTLRSNLTDDTRYIHKDHLGSIDTVTNDDSTNVQVIERRSFDPFGQSRTPSCITAVCQTVQSVASSSTTNRGFTGHEHLEEVGLIHMNGRVYDPELGRFLSADPNVQAPFNPQNLNRYSYVNNNPLSYTDPSGFFFKKLRNAFRSAFKSIARAIKPYIRTIVAIVIAVYAPYLLTTYASFSAGASTFTAGFLSGVVSGGGDLKQGIISGLTAGAFGAVGGVEGLTGIAKVAAHGTVGGLSAAASGGDFKSGFLSAAFTQGVSQNGGIGGLKFSNNTATKTITTLQRAKNATIAAITGGTGSVVGGGKFKNGAVTGAFSRLFNDDAHNPDRSRTQEGGIKSIFKGIAGFFRDNHAGLSAGITGTIGGNPYLGLPGGFLGGGVTVTLTTDLQLVVTFTANVQAGVGVFAGVGVQLGVSTFDGIVPTYSSDVGLHSEANAGAGPAVGVSGDYGNSSASGFKGVRGGAGFGANVSAGVQRNTTLATPPLINWKALAQ